MQNKLSLGLAATLALSSLSFLYFTFSSNPNKIKEEENNQPANTKNTSNKIMTAGGALGSMLFFALSSKQIPIAIKAAAEAREHKNSAFFAMFLSKLTVYISTFMGFLALTAIGTAGLKIWGELNKHNITTGQTTSGIITLISLGALLYDVNKQVDEKTSENQMILINSHVSTRSQQHPRDITQANNQTLTPNKAIHNPALAWTESPSPTKLFDKNNSNASAHTTHDNSTAGSSIHNPLLAGTQGSDDDNSLNDFYIRSETFTGAP